MELPGIAHVISEILGGGCQTAAARVRAGGVHQREVGVDASLSVMHDYDQQRRIRCGAWCEERAGAAAGAGAARQARGVILSTGQLRKSKGESVSGAERRSAKQAEVQRRRTVSTDLHVTKTILSLCIVLG